MKTNRPKASPQKAKAIQAKHDNKRTERLVIMINKTLDNRMRMHGAANKIKITEMVEAGLDMYLNQADKKGKGK